MSPLISVVMSVYNGEKYLREAVDSIINQTFTDFEFIIINDGSNDDTRAILESYKDDRIILLHQENIGLTKSLNRGLALAKGKYFARQDADDISHPDRFAKQVAYLEQNPDCLVLGTWVEFIDEAGLKYDVFRYPVDFFEIREALQTYNPFGHGSIMARTNSLIEYNGYNEKFYYTQDYDFWLRLSEVGELRNLPDELYSLRYWPGSISISRGYIQGVFAFIARQDALKRKSQMKNEAFVGELLENKVSMSATDIIPNKTDKIKILYVSHSSDIAGAENSLLTLLKFLDRKSFVPVVILPSEGPLKEKIEELGVTTYTTPLEWNVKVLDYIAPGNEDIAQRVKNIVEIIQLEKPDIVHTNTSVIWEGALAAKAFGVPHIWHLHEKLYEHPSLQSLIPLPLHYWIIDELSDKIVVVANYLKNQIGHFISPDKLLTIYNGIDADRFKCSPDGGLREQFSIPAETALAVTLGSLIKEKGHDILLTAAYFAKSKGCAVKFLMLGAGSPEAVQSLSERIEQLDLGDTVFYLGFREDIPQIINACDFLIISSLIEMFPLAALEAMAAGKPVVATDCGGTSESITDGESGFIVPINDPIALCQKIIELVDNREQLIVMGKNAFKILDENFRAEVYAGHFENLYKKTIALGNTSSLSEKENILFNSCLETYQSHVEKIRLLADSCRNIDERNQLLSESNRQIAERDLLLAEFHQQLNKKDLHLAEFHQQLNKKDLQLAEFHQQLNKKDLQLADYHQQLNQKNLQLADSTIHLADRDRELAETSKTIVLLTAEINATQNTIQNILDSLSWKITGPLRILGTVVLKAKRIVDFAFLKMPHHLTMHNVRLFLKYVKLFGWKVTLHEAYKAVMAAPQSAGEFSVPLLLPLSLVDKSGHFQEYDISISVVIPTKNAGDSFYQLLTMVRSQKGIREIEIVVVDSGSTDNTVSAAKEYGARVIEIPPESFSHSYARNLGAENATSEFLFFTVQDALFPSDTFFHEFYEIYSLNEVAAVSCAEYPREDADLFYRCCCWNHYEFLEVTRQDRILEKPAEENYITLRKNGQLSDIANFISRDQFMNYKYRDDYAEDLDLGIRLIKDGFRIAFLSSIKIIHSHNRPAYYYLKRGHVDQLFLTKKFPDYPMTALAPEEQPRDILAAYAALCTLVLKTLSTLKLPYGTGKLFDLIDREIGATPRACDITPFLTSNPYIDSNFMGFLNKVQSISPAAVSTVGPGKSNLLLSLSYFVPTIGRFMTETTDAVDEYALEELKHALFKAFALLCGVSLANSMIVHEEGAKKLFESIGINLREGV